MNIFKNIYFQLLLLQLEEYDIVRFLKAMFKTGGRPPKSPIRKPLVWTAKIKLVLASSLIILFAFLFLFIKIKNRYFFVLMPILFLFESYIFFAISVAVLYPLDFFIKELTIARAKNKIRKFKSLKIIGVAGSYGKTGLKEFISTVLEQKYNVVKTGGSVNTPYAIAKLILNKLTNDTQIFVLEMGEYYRGDIENICKIAQPDISVVTGINEAHLERLKTIDNTVSTIFEIVENMNPKGLVVLNAKDKTVKSNYKRFVQNQETYLYQNRNRGVFDENIPGYVINISKNKVFFPLLGSYNLDKIDAAVFIGRKLGLNDNELVKGIKNIKPIPHRLQPIANTQSKTLIIDDSYNGNPDGVEEAIKTLKLFGKRTKIYVTPGLVEMGEKSPEIHYNIGRSLADTADKVVLIKNSVTPDIERGLLNSKFNPKNIVWFESGTEAYKNIKNLAKPGTVVLLQNDWPDNYL